MPIVQALMADLRKRYGQSEGERVYFAMEAEGKGPFGKNGKYHALHQAFAHRNGIPAIESPGKPKRRGR